MFILKKSFIFTERNKNIMENIYTKDSIYSKRFKFEGEIYSSEVLDTGTKEKVENFLKYQDLSNNPLNLTNINTYNNFIIRSNIGKHIYERYKNKEDIKFKLGDVLEIIGNCEQEIIDMIIK